MPFNNPNFHEAITLYLQRLPHAALTSILITVGAIAIGIVCGVLLALAQVSSARPLATAARLIVAVGRCIPVPPFLYLIYFSFLALVFPIDATQAGMLALGLLLAPYMAELFRSGIQSVSRGQIEAGLSMGMSTGLVNRRIILPQALKIMLPAIGTMAIGTLLNSAFAAVIGARDITGMARNIVNSLFTFELYFIVAGTYFLIAYPASRALAAAERRSKHDL
jgi:polar amino acid transport system permease protein